MKRLLLFSLFIFFNLVSYGQDWAPFKTTDTIKHFVAEDSFQINFQLRYLRPIQSISLKSKVSSTNSTNIVLEKGFSPNKMFNPNVSLSITDIVKGKILGDSISIFQDSSIIKSLDSLGFRLNFPHKYSLNKVWVFGKSVDYQLLANCDSIFINTINGTLDSIAKVKITVTNKLNQPVLNHPFNNTFTISKTLGLISVIDFTNLSSHAFRYNAYFGLNRPLTFNDNYTMTVGDEYHFEYAENNISTIVFQKFQNIRKVIADTLIGNKRTISFVTEKLRTRPSSTVIQNSSYSVTFPINSIYAENKSMIIHDTLLNALNFGGWQNQNITLFALDENQQIAPLILSPISLDHSFYGIINWSSFIYDSLTYEPVGLSGGTINNIVGIGIEYFSYGHNGQGSANTGESITYIKKGNQTWGTPFNFTVGLHETDNKKESFQLLPNPANNSLQIKTELNYRQMEIYDLQGRNVESFARTNSYDISSFPNGAYFIRIIGEEGVFTKKLIKQ